MKLPSFQFYPGDWMKDPALRGVSIAARGLWIDMLCLMHENDRRGYMQHPNGKPVTAEQLARMTGCSTDEATRMLAELIESGVCSCTEHGVIYSRRIVRDENKRRLCSEAGKKGGGNPTFGVHPKGVPKGTTKGDSKGVANPSSSTSSSSSTSDKDPPNPPAGGQEFQAAVAEWLAYKAEKGQRYKPRGLKAVYAQLAAMGEARAIAAIRASMAANYAGIFEPNTTGPPRPHVPRKPFVFVPREKT